MKIRGQCRSRRAGVAAASGPGVCAEVRGRDSKGRLPVTPAHHGHVADAQAVRHVVQDRELAILPVGLLDGVKLGGCPGLAGQTPDGAFWHRR